MRIRRTGIPRCASAILGALAAAPLLGTAAPAYGACGGVERFLPEDSPSSERPPLAVGDSIMLGAVDQLSRRGFEVDVRGCRQFSEGLSVIAARARTGTLPGVVVMALGTNWTVERRQVRRALITLGRNRVLGLVTPREVGGVASSDQSVMRAAGRRWPRRVRVLDWVRYSSGHWNWFWSDGLHLQPRGARALTRLVAPALSWGPPDYDAPPPVDPAFSAGSARAAASG
jgi:hypothetical protein